MSDSLQPHGLPQCTFPSFSISKVCSNSCHWIDDIQPSHLLSLHSPPAFNLSQHQGLFQWVLSSHQVEAKVLELQLQHLSFQWIFMLSFPSDWLVWSSCCWRDSQEPSPGPQFESISPSVLTIFMVQLSYPCMTTRNTIALTIQTFVSKVTLLLCNTLYTLVITFLPRSKEISGLQSPSAVILEPLQNKS